MESKEGGSVASDLLTAHLNDYLGSWSTDRDDLRVVSSERRLLPDWDGGIRKFVGVVDAAGHGVISVPPNLVEPVSELLAQADRSDSSPLRRLPALLNIENSSYFEGFFRFTASPEPFAKYGVWIPCASGDVPRWLKPFGGDVLLAFDDSGRYIAGVGIKRLSRFGRELAVVTEERARGAGLAKALISQASVRILEEGAIPIYLHSQQNFASARVADAVGFHDKGWRILGIHRQ